MTTLRALVRGDSGDVDRERVEAERLDEVLGVWVDFERVLGGVESRDVWNVLVLTLTFFLLELE